MEMKTGYINLIIGCMFSGKSTEVIRLARKYKSINKNVLIINHSTDTRYGNGIISSHDQEKLNAVALSEITDIINTPDYTDADVIIIEEAQFFNDLFDFVIKSADFDKKHLIVSGLDGDFKREKFGDILKLIPHADKVTKLNGFCGICKDGTPAIFTKRLSSSTDKTLVGGSDIYLPVCRYHYNN